MKHYYALQGKFLQKDYFNIFIEMSVESLDTDDIFWCIWGFSPMRWISSCNTFISIASVLCQMFLVSMVNIKSSIAQVILVVFQNKGALFFPATSFLSNPRLVESK